jgi:hypothetical protein
MRGRTGNRLCEAGKARGILRVVISEDVGNPLLKRWMCALSTSSLLLFRAEWNGNRSLSE